jgi:hypothetical protein
MYSELLIPLNSVKSICFIGQTTQTSRRFPCVILHYLRGKADYELISEAGTQRPAHASGDDEPNVSYFSTSEYIFSPRHQSDKASLISSSMELQAGNSCPPSSLGPVT